VKDIRRQTRRKFGSEERIRIVLEGLKGEESISGIWRKEGIAPALYYRWSKDLLKQIKSVYMTIQSVMLIPEKIKISRMNRRTLNWLLKSELLKQSTQKKLAWSSIKFRKYMRFTQDEKYEIIQLVEDSELGVNRTLVELDISKRTFYNWYGKYTKHGYDGFSTKRRANNSQWNRIPHQVEMKWLKLLWKFPNCLQESLLTA